MINIAQLEEMEEYIRSGKLEKDFLESGESQRYYFLELLEKLMDVAELADEAATRLIFRGLHPQLGNPEKDDKNADNTPEK